MLVKLKAKHILIESHGKTESPISIQKRPITGQVSGRDISHANIIIFSFRDWQKRRSQHKVEPLPFKHDLRDWKLLEFILTKSVPEIVIAVFFKLDLNDKNILQIN